MNYIDLLMKNNTLDSESPDYDEYRKWTNGKMRGGDDAKVDSSKYNMPSGSYPPIFICSTEKEKEIEEHQKQIKKEREFQVNKQTVSIKKIMEERRKIQPFIPFTK